MNTKVCVGYLTNIRDMFVIGSERCEGEALEYQQNFISALNYAIGLINDTERSQGEWNPISERLPEEKINPYTNDFDEVLCTTIWGDVRVYKFGKPIGHDKPHFWLGGGIMDEYVIAWQYKPGPFDLEAQMEGKEE